MKVYVLTEEYYNYERDIICEYECQNRSIRGVFDDRRKAIEEIETIINIRKQFVLDHFDENVEVMVATPDYTKDYTKYCTFVYSRVGSPFCSVTQGKDFWEFNIEEVEMNVGLHKDVESEISEYIAEEENWVVGDDA